VDVTEIPFNRLIGIARSDRPDRLLMLRRAADYQNHLGTVHASAQFALAEATSGAFLLQCFREQSGAVVPVVRRVEVKFSKPAQGPLYAAARLDGDRAPVLAQLENKGRAVIRVEVRIEDAEGGATMAASFDWFVSALERRAP